MRGSAASVIVIAGAIALGLVLDQNVEIWGQWITNFAVWLLFLGLLRRRPHTEQMGLLVCVLFATAGEILLSLVLGLYEYRLSNIPLFVPPGHALLFMLGSTMAARARDWVVWAVPLAAAPLALFLVATGADTLSGMLFAIFVLCLLFGPSKKLYATMFILALAMEIYGTRLGNWTWAARAPLLGLATLNPPLAAGAFYCVLDLMVMGVLIALRRRQAPPGLIMLAGVRRN
ncbi:MAG: hypothetical protein HY323_19525 [Betaproteobacteria bacterium]|nr:hypothetical protein [Betaproteobacteria bacterium]